MPRPCSVVGCPHKFIRPQFGMIHRFPSDYAMKKLWACLAGREFGDLEKLENEGICSYHFLVAQYKVRPGEGRRGQLFSTAVPTQNLPQRDQNIANDFVFSVDEVFAFVENSSKLEQSAINYEEEARSSKELKKTISKQSGSLADAQKEVIVLEKRCKELEKYQQLEEKRFQEKFREELYKCFEGIFTKRMLDLVLDGNSFKHWKEEDIVQSIAIYNTSAKAYKYLREQLGFPFPSKSCILEWLGKIDVIPGIIWPVIRLIKEEFLNFSSLQRAAIICFDEVNVDGRASFDLKNEKVWGPSKNMMMMTIRGVAYSWKQIIHFGFDIRLTKQLIEEIVALLYRVGVHVYAMVSDMGTVNRRLWKELGIKVDLKNETNSNYHFSHPVTSNPVFVIADFPHLIKLLRNHFIDKDIKLGQDFNNKTISAKVIQQIIDLQNGNDLQLTFKLAQKHLSRNMKERMHVRSAMELFSATTSKAIQFFYPEQEEMATFFQLINDGCDILNVRTNQITQNAYKSPLGSFWQQQTEVLDKLAKNVTELRFVEKRPSLKMFQKGFKLTCESMKKLFLQLQQPPVNANYLMTGYISQDHLESTFSKFRGIGSFNDHPLPEDAIQRVKTLIICNNLRKPTTGNVHEENETEFLSTGRLQMLIEGSSYKPSDPNIINPIQYLSHKFSSIRSTIPATLSAPNNLGEKIALGAAEFVAGYIAKKLIHTYPELKATSSYSGWINLISAGGLISPSEFWLRTFLKFEEYFQALHKASHGWDINRDIQVISPLKDYLLQLYPIPEKVIKLYLITRTKIRIQAINKKIAKIQRERRARKFLASIDPEPEDIEPQETEVPEEETQNFDLDEIDAVIDLGEVLDEEEELLDV